MKLSERMRFAALMLGIILLSPLAVSGVQTALAASDRAQDEVLLTLVGHVVNSQTDAIDDAEVRVYIGGRQQMVRVADGEGAYGQTGPNGFFILDLVLPKDLIESETIALEISRSGYRTVRQGFAKREIARSEGQYYLRIPDVVMPRIFNQAFFLATAIFIVSFAVITLNLLHETIAVLLGASSMLAISYFFGTSNIDYWIIGFHRAITFIDFDVIFLLLGMMIFMAVMSQTGVFQWLALRAYRLARGKSFLVAAGLVLLTGATSAVLNDTTVMLLMTPISIQIALVLDIHPAAIVIPEVLASNIGGAATIIGTPPNTIIGSYVGLSFNQFLVNMLPVSLLGMLILLAMTRWIYRSEFLRKEKEPSQALLEQLEQEAQISDPNLLRKSLFLFGLTMILFFVEDLFRMPPAVVAILGSTALLLWVRPNVSEMLRKVDWTTLVFFMSMFMMVGGIQEVGLIQAIAESVKSLAGDNLLLATTLVIWVSAIASAVVANIPFTSAIVPVTVFLTHSIPGAENNVLYWALALGAGLGGNATYIGSAPNIVAMGIMDRAGYRLKFGEFSRTGIPVTIVTVFMPMLWIFIRYFWLNF